MKLAFELDSLGRTECNIACHYIHHKLAIRYATEQRKQL